MKALILVGGYGTRLRPLTLSVPKPLIEFCNKPIVEYQIKSLMQAGVGEFILAVAYQPSVMMEALSQMERTYNVRITCSREAVPLGTAGPIRLAKPLLLRGPCDGDGQSSSSSSSGSRSSNSNSNSNINSSSSGDRDSNRGDSNGRRDSNGAMKSSTDDTTTCCSSRLPYKRSGSGSGSSNSASHFSCEEQHYSGGGYRSRRNSMSGDQGYYYYYNSNCPSGSATTATRTTSTNSSTSGTSSSNSGSSSNSSSSSSKNTTDSGTTSSTSTTSSSDNNTNGDLLGGRRVNMGNEKENGCVGDGGGGGYAPRVVVLGDEGKTEREGVRLAVEIPTANNQEPLLAVSEMPATAPVAGSTTAPSASSSSASASVVVGAERKPERESVAISASHTVGGDGTFDMPPAATVTEEEDKKKKKKIEELAAVETGAAASHNTNTTTNTSSSTTPNSSSTTTNNSNMDSKKNKRVVGGSKASRNNFFGVGSDEEETVATADGEENKEVEEDGEKKNIDRDKPTWRGDNVHDCFFVCNSDVICSFPLLAMLQFHKRTGAEATILVTEVENPSAYGVVQHDNMSGKVHAFVEKPKHFAGNFINAGVYILNNSVIDRIQLRPSSLEKDIFPLLAKEETLYCFRLDGYWADIGQPKDFLKGMQLHLEALRCMQEQQQQPQQQQQLQLQQQKLLSQQQHVQKRLPSHDDTQGDVEEKTAPILISAASEAVVLPFARNTHFIGNVLVDPSARIGDDCVIGPDVTIDRDVEIGRGCRVQQAALMAGVRVGDFSWIQKTILGWQSSVGKWCRVEGLTVVGEDVQVADECCLNGTCILPHKFITQSIHDPGTIIL